MTLTHSVREVLRELVVLEIERITRMYLNICKASNQRVINFEYCQFPYGLSTLKPGGVSPEGSRWCCSIQGHRTIEVRRNGLFVRIAAKCIRLPRRRQATVEAWASNASPPSFRDRACMA
jgi:hypothetical protein